MKLVRRFPNKPVTYVVFNNGYEHEWSDLADLVDNLESTNAFGDVLVMNNEKLQAILEEMGAMNHRAAGGCYKGKNFKEFQKLVEALYDVKPDVEPDPQALRIKELETRVKELELQVMTSWRKLPPYCVE